MNYRIIYTIICFLFFCRGALHAQDPHFSQYFGSPLSFNPAFTGYFEGAYRAAFNFRNQWSNSGSPFITGTASFDTKIMSDVLNTNDKWGIGMMTLYDYSAGGIFKNSYFSVSSGFNKGLDADGMQSIGIGIQACYARNSIDFSRTSFNNQFTGRGYDLSLSSGEIIRNNSASYFDINAGILYNYCDENNNRFIIGSSIYHVLRPSLPYFVGNNQSVHQRYTLHAGANLAMGMYDQLFMGTHLMQQAGSSDVVIGGAYGWGLGSDEKHLYLGSWLRFKDAMYPYIGLHTGSYQIGLTVDITTSELKKLKGFRNSSELSLLYFFNKNSSKGIHCYFF